MGNRLCYELSVPPSKETHFKLLKLVLFSALHLVSDI